MVVREPMRMRKTMLAGAVALALSGTGAALAWSATGTPAPSPSTPGQQGAPQQGVPGKDAAPGQQNKQDRKAQRGQLLHGEAVARKPDGTYQTVLEQNGTVESVSDSAITVKSDDGFSHTYTVNGDTKITRIPAAPASSGSTDGPEATPSPEATPTPGATGDDGKRLKPTDGTIADIAAGDTVRITGVKDGDKATAARIVKGAGNGPGLGLGRGLGRGLGHTPGHSPGLGHKTGKGNHQDGEDS